MAGGGKGFSKAVDLTRLDGRPIKNRIKKIGIELEGAWKFLPKGVNLEHDGSVTGFPDDIARTTARGELPSPPLEIGEWKEWIKKFYPHHVNQSCGMHVHMSFGNAMTYQRIMDPSFPATIIAGVGKWAERERFPMTHHIWQRIKGDSGYCQHKFYADEQVATTRKDHDRQRVGNRYTVINYAYNRYGTAECRLLPMMDTVDQAISAIEELMAITNKYLVVTSVRERPLVAEARDDSGDILEELRINV